MAEETPCCVAKRIHACPDLCTAWMVEEPPCLFTQTHVAGPISLRLRHGWWRNLHVAAAQSFDSAWWRKLHAVVA
eukprot:11098933-Karenia_brevis.AAC.1